MLGVAGRLGTASPSPSLRPVHSLPLSFCPGVEGLSLDMSSLVDIRDYVNQELALRFHTDIGSQGAFFTDLNGFQVIPRALRAVGPGGGRGIRGENDQGPFRLGTPGTQRVPRCP